MPDEQPDTNPDLRELITLKQAAEMSRLSYSHLRLLARHGDIWAIRLGHNWFTTDLLGFSSFAALIDISHHKNHPSCGL